MLSELILGLNYPNFSPTIQQLSTNYLTQKARHFGKNRQLSKIWEKNMPSEILELNYPNFSSTIHQLSTNYPTQKARHFGKNRQLSKIREKNIPSEIFKTVKSEFVNVI